MHQFKILKLEDSAAFYFWHWSQSTAKNKPEYNDPIPTHDTFSIASELVNETRIINVWMPPQYETSMDSIAVLYMANGGIKEDFPHIANTLAKLVAAKSIPPILLVGIEHTERG